MFPKAAAWVGMGRGEGVGRCLEQVGLQLLRDVTSAGT